jgi:hypothetical protein
MVAAFAPVEARSREQAALNASGHDVDSDSSQQLFPSRCQRIRAVAWEKRTLADECLGHGDTDEPSQVVVTRARGSHRSVSVSSTQRPGRGGRRDERQRFECSRDLRRGKSIATLATVHLTADEAACEQASEMLARSACGNARTFRELAGRTRLSVQQRIEHRGPRRLSNEHSDRPEISSCHFALSMPHPRFGPHRSAGRTRRLWRVALASHGAVCVGEPEGRHYSCRSSSGCSAVLVDETAAALDANAATSAE